MLRTTRRSAIVAMLVAVPPATALLTLGEHADVSVPAFMMITLATGTVFIGGLWITGHPLMREILSVLSDLRSAIATRSLEQRR
jgi:hypothetical protein